MGGRNGDRKRTPALIQHSVIPKFRFKIKKNENINSIPNQTKFVK